MKLPANNANHIKIPLSCLKITDNVRMNFDEAEIEELANSIRQNGLMNPITVRPAETDADGNKTYEVIAGGRRIRAHHWLCEHGDDFSLIECCIRTGDKWALQMIENIQRTDLTPREKENAVSKALDEGLTQSQIAEKLSKPIQWVSDIVAGARIRMAADKAGLKTDEITTKTLSQLRSIPEEKLESCLTQLIAEGGTYRAATRMMQEEKNPATTHVSTPDEDFISDDESIISPSEMSEEDFHDDVDFEKDRKESRFVVGTEIDTAGERLFFKNLWHSRYVVLKINKKNIVCIVSSSLYAETISFFYRENNDFSKERTVKLSVSEIDSEIENEQHNIYAIPDNAKAIKKPSLSKKNNSDFNENKTASKQTQQAFNWYLQPTDPNAMRSVLGRLPFYLNKMPPDTKICIQAGNHTAEIQSVIYEPENNKLIFRAFDSSFNEELKK